jgi:cytochrome b involved in lipid metabolism
MGTVRLERRIKKLENIKVDDEAMLAMRSPSVTTDKEVYVISDDESDVGGRTNNTSRRTFSHGERHDDNSTNTPTTAAATATALCDSCQFCNDTCDVPNCVECQSKTSHNRQQPQQQRLYTMCQIRRHTSIENSVWIVADDTVYDVTSYIQYHPGGMECILKKAGGKHNCHRDLQFHSHRGQQLFNKYAIGKVISCPRCVAVFDTTSNKTSAATNKTTTNRPSMLTTLEMHRWFLW